MKTDQALSMNLHFTPTIDIYWLIAIALCGAVLLMISLMQYRRGVIIRSAIFGAFMLALLNPSIIKQERSYVKDSAVIVVDQSTSQKIGQREERTKTALAHLQKQIEDMGKFNLRIIYAPKDNKLTSRTDLFTQLDQSLADIPQKQRAGVIFLSDGQVHDIPQNQDKLNTYGTIHLMLSGSKNDKDRQIIVTNAPAYGMVGKDITIKYRIEDSANINEDYAKLTLTMHSGQTRSFHAPVNVEQSITLPLDHPSQNIFSLEVEKIDNEITYANNKTAIIINGVRDRMKVLLVSGIPHTGERTWRNLLTSDPGVDLVHFTILREPHKLDYTPKNEMSLIAFPFRELFEIKLYDFDLIIFDRYRVNNILPRHYFRNIARYVREGGAFLEASGPAFASKRSIYNTAIGDILPARPLGTVSNQAFKPKITELGHAHPVTKSLIWNNGRITQNSKESWGAWLRSIDVESRSGDILMSAANDSPLLILDRVEKGRVAQISSDHIWLWSRGYDGGGPHAELLRRIVHWLMKEPELDERALSVAVHKNTITITKQNHRKITEENIYVTQPNGTQQTLKLKNNKNGLLEHKYSADQLGIYAFEDMQGMRKFAIIGDINPLELRGVKTTSEKFEPIVKSTNGTTIWLEEVPLPKVISASNNNRLGGRNWVALKSNNNYNVTGIKDISLLPEWAVLFILLSALIILWWKEGRD